MIYNWKQSWWPARTTRETKVGGSRSSRICPTRLSRQTDLDLYVQNFGLTKDDTGDVHYSYIYDLMKI